MIIKPRASLHLGLFSGKSQLSIFWGCTLTGWGATGDALRGSSALPFLWAMRDSQCSVPHSRQHLGLQEAGCPTADPWFGVAGRGGRRRTAEARRPNRGRQWGGPGRRHPRAGRGHPEAPEGHSDPDSAVLSVTEIKLSYFRPSVELSNTAQPPAEPGKHGSAFPPLPGRGSAHLQLHSASHLYLPFSPALHDFWWLPRFLWTSLIIGLQRTRLVLLYLMRRFCPCWSEPRLRLLNLESTRTQKRIHIIN